MSTETSARIALVESYFEGFRQGDHARILGCLTEDIAWDLPGIRHLTGKAAFDAEIANPDFTGRPTLTLDRLLEDTARHAVIAIGDGAATHRSGSVFRFAYCDVFTFRGDLICRVESYLAALNPPPAG